MVDSEMFHPSTLYCIFDTRTKARSIRLTTGSQPYGRVDVIGYPNGTVYDELSSAIINP